MIYLKTILPKCYNNNLFKVSLPQICQTMERTIFNLHVKIAKTKGIVHNTW